MNTSRETIRTIDLGYEQMMIFDGGPGARVRVLYGAAWLTGEGDPVDAIVGAGSETTLRPGRTLIEALEPSRMQIVQRGGRFSSRLVASLLQWGRAGRRLIARLQFGAMATQPHG